METASRPDPRMIRRGLPRTSHARPRAAAARECLTADDSDARTLNRADNYGHPTVSLRLRGSRFNRGVE